MFNIVAGFALGIVLGFIFSRRYQAHSQRPKQHKNSPSNFFRLDHKKTLPIRTRHTCVSTKCGFGAIGTL